MEIGRIGQCIDLLHSEAKGDMENVEFCILVAIISLLVQVNQNRTVIIGVL